MVSQEPSAKGISELAGQEINMVSQEPSANRISELPSAKRISELAGQEINMVSQEPSANGISELAGQKINMVSKERSAKRLSEVAEELVKAAYDQTEVVAVDLQREIAASLSGLKEESVALRCDANSKLDAVNNTMHTMNQTLQETKTTTESLLAAINTLNKSIREEGKHNRLVAALQRIDSVENYSYSRSGVGGGMSIQPLLKNIITSFIKGFGYKIDGLILTNYNATSRVSKGEEKKEAFRKKLTETVHSLTGTVPKTVKDSSGAWVIWYE